jgi:hypothetical protein
MSNIDDVKIKNLFKDKALTDALRLVIQQSFLKKKKERDIHFLAAKSIAIELLDEVWADLERSNSVVGDESTKNKNVGL